jgi:hypothetical protein
MGRQGKFLGERAFARPAVADDERPLPQSLENAFTRPIQRENYRASRRPDRFCKRTAPNVGSDGLTFVRGNRKVKGLA